MVREVKVNAIDYTFDGYPRDVIDTEVVTEYKEKLEAGIKLPPIVVFEEGTRFHLADGLHRLEAHKALTNDKITAVIHIGGSKDALIYAVGANDRHGRRRTSGDKKKAVELVLRDESLRKKSTNAIAKMCRVSWATVDDVWKASDLKPRKSVEAKRGGKTFNVAAKRKKSGTSPCRTVTALSKILEPADTARSWFKAEFGVRKDGKTPLSQEKIEEISEMLDDLHVKTHELVGELAKAICRITDTRAPLNVYSFKKTSGIIRNKEFEKKDLAKYTVTVGLGCGHQCAYCSTAVMNRTNSFFQKIHQTSFTRGNAIVDKGRAERLKKAIIADKATGKITAEDVILFSNLDDGWSPEALKYNLGRKVLEVLLDKTNAQIRLLTKGASIADCLDEFEEYKNRIIVGLSTGMAKDQDEIGKLIEPNASLLSERYAALKKAKQKGFKTFGMLCPCLPGISDTKPVLRKMFKDVLACGVEHIWLEPVNPRGQAMKNMANALAAGGKIKEARIALSMSNDSNWSKYACDLIVNAIAVAGEVKALDKLRILLYPSHLKGPEYDRLKKIKKGIIWL